MDRDDGRKRDCNRFFADVSSRTIAKSRLDIGSVVQAMIRRDEKVIVINPRLSLLQIVNPVVPRMQHPYLVEREALLNGNETSVIQLLRSLSRIECLAD